MRITAHDCEEFATEHVATSEMPYHYVGSGLSNVDLIGVKYWVCDKCGHQAAEIPSLRNLLNAIGRTIVEKNSPLIGSQVKFLRKRLSKKAVDFAAMIGITPQHLSMMESGDSKLSEGRDKLIRFTYAFLSQDRQLKACLVQEREVEKWLMDIHGRGASERIIATWLGNQKWRVEAAPMAECA